MVRPADSGTAAPARTSEPAGDDRAISKFVEALRARPVLAVADVGSVPAVAELAARASHAVLGRVLSVEAGGVAEGPTITMACDEAEGQAGSGQCAVAPKVQMVEVRVAVDEALAFGDSATLEQGDTFVIELAVGDAGSAATAAGAQQVVEALVDAAPIGVQVVAFVAGDGARGRLVHPESWAYVDAGGTLTAFTIDASRPASGLGGATTWDEVAAQLA